jgi:hypothetical protein
MWNDYPTAPVSGGLVMAGSGGSWSVGNKAVMVIACYNGTTYTDLDMLGWTLTANLWGAYDVATADTAKQLTVTWLAAGHLPDYYVVLIQPGVSTYDFTQPGYIAATVAGTATTTTIATEPSISTATLTLATSYTAMTLVPINLIPQARDSVVAGINSQTARRSFVTDTLYAGHTLQFFATTTTAANYRKLQKWCQKDVTVKLLDNDTTTYVSYWTGRLSQPTSLNSDSKQSGYPSIQFTVETEVYN